MYAGYIRLPSIYVRTKNEILGRYCYMGDLRSGTILLHLLFCAFAIGHELRISEGTCGAYLGLNPFTWKNIEDRKRTALTAPEDVALALMHAPPSLR